MLLLVFSFREPVSFKAAAGCLGSKLRAAGSRGVESS